MTATATRVPQHAGKQASGADNFHFKLVRFSAIQLATTAYYLVENLLPREGIIVVWGPPKCGKSFWTFDLLMHIALGWSYRGRRVEAGAVVYIACEGERGLSARAAAFKLKHGIEDSDPNFYILTAQLSLVAHVEPLIRDIKAQIPDGGVAAVAIDTLNRSYTGDENSAEDMGAYLRAADAIRAEFKCAVLVIHHCGTDDKRPRGSSALPGFVEAQLAVKRDQTGLLSVSVEYMKDGQEGTTVNSRLEAIEVGNTTDEAGGRPITSCVIVDADGEAPLAPSRKRLAGATARALDLLGEAINTGGEAPPVSNHIPTGVRAVKETVWREYCYRGGISESDDGPAKRQAFNRVRKALLGGRHIAIWDEWVWACDRAGGVTA